MKKMIFLIVLCLCCMTNLAQAQDIIYLKNGSIIKGSIVEHVPNSMVKIETSDGYVHKFAIDEVDRMVFTPVINSYQNSSSIFGLKNDYLKKGFRGFIEFGVDVQVDDETYDSYNGFISLPITVGYQVNPYLFVGGGMAPGITSNGRYRYDYYDYYYDDYYYDRYRRGRFDSHFVMPIYGALRFDFINARVSPFLDLRAGYGVTDYSRGAYVSFAVGCRVRRFNFSMGYTYQNREDYDKFNHVAFRFGYGF